MPTLLKLPQQIDTVIRSRMLSLAEKIASDYESVTYSSEIEIEKIPHNSCDGFIAFTNGGYKISLVFDTSSAISSGKFITQDVRDFCERLQRDAEKYFISDNQERLEEIGYSEDLANFWDILEENDDIKEEYYNYEMGVHFNGLLC